MENSDDNKKNNTSIARKIFSTVFITLGAMLFIFGFMLFSLGRVLGWYMCFFAIIFLNIGIFANAKNRVKNSTSTVITTLNNLTNASKNLDTVVVGDNDDLYVKKCPSCGKVNNATAKFCNSCGQEFSKVLNDEKTNNNSSNNTQQTTNQVSNTEDGKKICPNCGWHNEKEDRFCRDCGKRI